MSLRVEQKFLLAERPSLRDTARFALSIFRLSESVITSTFYFSASPVRLQNRASASRSPALRNSITGGLTLRFGYRGCHSVYEARGGITE